MNEFRKYFYCCYKYVHCLGVQVFDEVVIVRAAKQLLNAFGKYLFVQLVHQNDEELKARSLKVLYVIIEKLGNISDYKVTLAYLHGGKAFKNLC